MLGHGHLHLAWNHGQDFAFSPSRDGGRTMAAIAPTNHKPMSKIND